MRWTEFLVTLPPGRQSRLVNTFTLGLGQLALAARRCHANAPAALMMGTLAAAYISLREVLDALGPSVATGSTLTTGRAGGAGALDRSGPIANGDVAQARRVVAHLQAAVAAARSAGMAALANDEIAVLHGHLREAVQALLDLREQAVKIR